MSDVRFRISDIGVTLTRFATLTGLAPGLHVNNVAALVLAGLLVREGREAWEGHHHCC